MLASMHLTLVRMSVLHNGCMQASPSANPLRHCVRRLKDLNERCPGELKAFYECMDYYRWATCCAR
jgi:hypothetical protein